MNNFYHKTSFEFSTEAKSWVLDRYHMRFNQHFFHDFDPTQINSHSQIQWRDSIAGQEIIDFLKQYNCTIDYYGIGVFISNTETQIYSNPHSDIKFSNGTQSKIKSRFNVMILGNQSDEMVWWQDFEYNDARSIDTKFTSSMGHSYVSKSVPGNNPSERWDYLGEPTFRAGNILTPSAFVKTDCAHAVILSSEPRLLVTVAIDRSLSEIVLY